MKEEMIKKDPRGPFYLFGKLRDNSSNSVLKLVFGVDLLLLDGLFHAGRGHTSPVKETINLVGEKNHGEEEGWHQCSQACYHTCIYMYIHVYLMG